MLAFSGRHFTSRYPMNVTLTPDVGATPFLCPQRKATSKILLYGPTIEPLPDVARRLVELFRFGGRGIWYDGKRARFAHPALFGINEV